MANQQLYMASHWGCSTRISHQRLASEAGGDGIRHIVAGEAWNQTKLIYPSAHKMTRQECDDGNVINGDGCTSFGPWCGIISAEFV